MPVPTTSMSSMLIGVPQQTIGPLGLAAPSISTPVYSTSSNVSRKFGAIIPHTRRYGLNPLGAPPVTYDTHAAHADTRAPCELGSHGLLEYVDNIAVAPDV